MSDLDHFCLQGFKFDLLFPTRHISGLSLEIGLDSILGPFNSFQTGYPYPYKLLEGMLSNSNISMHSQTYMCKMHSVKHLYLILHSRNLHQVKYFEKHVSTCENHVLITIPLDFARFSVPIGIIFNIILLLCVLNWMFFKCFHWFYFLLL